MLEAILESWDRQAQIVDNIASIVTPELMGAKSREGEFSIGEHLCHIHGTRRWWIKEIDPKYLEGSASLYTEVSEDDYVASEDLDLIRQRLKESAASVRHAMVDLLPDGKAGPYDHPLFYLQHMIWHEGWHVGAIFHAFRANGQEITEEWEEPNVWGLWRTEEQS
jgi:uncharacterized damage-inducible protein DinB